MKYCNDCGCDDLKMDIVTCPECGGEDIRSMKKSDVATPLVKDKTSSIGICALPNDMNHLLNLVALKIGTKEFVYPKFVLDVRNDGVYTNLLCPTKILSSVMYVSRKYFKDTWGTGTLPFDSEKILHKRLKWLRAEDDCTLVYNPDAHVLMYYSSVENQMSDNTVAPESITSYIDDASKMPFKHSMEDFSVTLGVRHYKEIYAKVRVSEVQRIIKKLSDFDKDYYPLSIDKSGFSCKVGDIDNPTDTGAFIEKMSIADYHAPESEINVTIGDRFKHLFEALPKDALVTIYFVESGLPIWVVMDIEDSNGKKAGKIGYIVAPRIKID